MNAEYKEKKHYQEYMDRVQKAISKYNGVELGGMVEELESHIYEAMHSEKLAELSVDLRLEQVLTRLGAPEKLIKMMVAEQELEGAVGRFNTIGIFKAVIKNILTGSRFVLACCLYLFSLVFFLVLIAKIIYPECTGLFVRNNEFAGFGFLAQVDASQTEILGYWILPVTAVAGVIFYLIATVIFRQVIKRRKSCKPM